MTIINPIMQGIAISDKEFILDVQVMLNVKSHRIFNDKFKLSVVNLSQIELATEEDKAWELDYWARLFKAKTWEEIKMLAEKNEFLEEAAQSVYVANEDEIIRQMCLAREDRERHERTVQRDMKRLAEAEAKVSEQERQLSERDQQLSKKDQELSQKNQQLSEQKQRITELEKLLVQLQEKK